MRTTPLVLLLALAGCGKSPAPQAPVPPGTPDTPPAIPADAETVEHPTYKLWAKFAPGTSVTQRTTTENEDSAEKTVTTINYTLKERTDDHVVVVSKAATVHYTGRVEENPADEVKTPKVLLLPPGAKKEDWGKPKKGTRTGEETVAAAGKEYKAAWVESKDSTEAGELFVRTWTSPDMPGGLVRSVSKVPAKKATITVEVIEVKIP